VSSRRIKRKEKVVIPFNENFTREEKIKDNF